MKVEQVWGKTHPSKTPEVPYVYDYANNHLVYGRPSGFHNDLYNAVGEDFLSSGGMADLASRPMEAGLYHPVKDYIYPISGPKNPKILQAIQDQLRNQDIPSKISKEANIFDPIQGRLDQGVFSGIKPRPDIVKFIEDHFYRTMSELYIDNPEQYFDLALTGSLTTYQYSETSDCDISVFVHYDDLMDAKDVDEPVDIRKELIPLVTTEIDGTVLPGTQHPLQFFIIPPGNTIDNYFKPGMRSGWSFNDRGWIVPPERSRSHDIATEMPELYARAAAMADKMTVLLDSKDYDAAREFFAQIHKKRNADEAAGLGDFSEGNIVYKYLLHEGLFDRLRGEANVHIAKVASSGVRIQYGQGGHEYEFCVNFNQYDDAIDNPIPQPVFKALENQLPDLPMMNRGSRIEISPIDGLKLPTDEDIAMASTRIERALTALGFEVIQNHRYSTPVHNIDKDHISPEHKIPILYDFDNDRIIMSSNYDFHRGSKIIGDYDGKDVYLHGVSKQWINPNYFKRLWVASFPTRTLDKVHMDGKAVETRPSDAMTYTQQLPWLVQSSDPWRKGKDWKDFIKNEGIIVDFQVGDKKDDPIEGKVKEITHKSIKIEVAPGETRTFEDDFLKQIKFRVRDDKHYLSHWKESAVVLGRVGDCLTSDCDYEFTPADHVDIALSRGWFACPQCNHTHYVRTHELKYKTSAWGQDIPKEYIVVDTTGAHPGQPDMQGIPVAYDFYAKKAYIGTTIAFHDELIGRGKGPGWENMIGCEFGEIKNGVLFVSLGHRTPWEAIAQHLGVKLEGALK